MKPIIPAQHEIQAGWNHVPQSPRPRVGGKAPVVHPQARRIAAKFGGFANLHRALVKHLGERDRSAIYRWGYDRAKGGTGGIIPASDVELVAKVARLEGIVLLPEDWSPDYTAMNSDENDNEG